MKVLFDLTSYLASRYFHLLSIDFVMQRSQNKLDAYKGVILRVRDSIVAVLKRFYPNEDLVLILR